jgi:hypothetical protein
MIAEELAGGVYGQAEQRLHDLVPFRPHFAVLGEPYQGLVADLAVARDAVMQKEHEQDDPAGQQRLLGELLPTEWLAHRGAILHHGARGAAAD